MDTWFWRANGRLYFVYRAKKWDEGRYLNSTEVTSVTAYAYDPQGGSLTVTQQPSWSPSHNGYVGYISSESVGRNNQVSLKLVPTLTAEVNANWAPVRVADINIDDKDYQQLSSFSVPSFMAIPPTVGNVKVYKLYLRIRSLSGEFFDPSSTPTVTMIGPQDGISVGDVTRTATGLYEVDVSLSYNATREAMLTFTATWNASGHTYELTHSTYLTSYGSVQSIAGDISTLLSRLTDARAAKLDRDLSEKGDVTAATQTLQTDIAASTNELGALIDVLITRVGTSSDVAGTATLFAYLRQIVDLYLASPTKGIEVIKSVVDAINTSVGTHTGTASQTGTVHEKLSAAYTGSAPNAPTARHGRL